MYLVIINGFGICMFACVNQLSQRSSRNLVNPLWDVHILENV